MKNLIGKKFERLTVIQRGGNNRWGNSRWLCRCECGNEKIILGKNLKSGHTKSCGCLHIEKTIERSITHGHTTKRNISKTYQAWHDMISRCTNPNNKRYQDYGGRGIKVCKRWLKFENFLEDMGEVPEGCQIDRIDNNKGYDKSNCKWSTRKEQQRNMRNNLYFTYKNKTQLLIGWAEQFNINYQTLYSRIFILGWSIEKALTTPVRKRSSNE